MFLKLTILAIFSLSSTLFARSPATYYQVKSDLQKVSSRNLSEFVNELIKASAPSRMVGHPGHAKAKEYLVDKIQKLDPKNTGKLEIRSSTADVNSIANFYQKDFDDKIEGKVPKISPDYQKWLRFTTGIKGLAVAKKDFPVENIVWEKAGLNSKKMLVLVAHYDTISFDKNTLLVNEKDPTPGANYNASSVAILLGLIKTIAQFDLNYSVRVVFLDWQGIGFHGSEIYAKELKALQNSGTEILGVMNLEMLGQDTSFFDKTKKTGNMSMYTRDLSDETKFGNKLISHGQNMTKKVEFELKPNGFESSDNINFWKEGFLCVTFSQNWEDDFNPKFYQTPQDTAETLNHETLWNSYQYVGGGALGILLDITQ